ncbi:MAG: Z1 domain-containing protein [Nanoarchaeota archaeon]|nr:Z1 domain-containing protein [Nanoarchaeota archaeon]
MKTEYITLKNKEKPSYGKNWVPTIGDETEKLLDYFRDVKNITEASCDRLKKEAVEILSKFGNPLSIGNSETGLVFGYIQSGKTMSYTTLSALAKDNNYQIIILIGGITNNLLNQTSERLSRDLRINEDGNFEWKVLQNPTLNEKQLIQNVLEQNRKFSGISQKTILITVLKQAARLKKLISVLNSLNLEVVPTLIIDDEGDQASLNTAARKNAKLDEKGMSTIYSRMIELKEKLPHHTLLQYTATPQGPFFINLLDRLSPNFIELLNPGEDYVGGKEFFDKNKELTREIPASEIYDKDNEFEDPPETLMESMRVFFLCVTLGLISKKGYIKSKHLSMMVHPSHLTAKHNQYYNWIIKIRKRWIRILEEADDNVEKKTLLFEFENDYADLKKTNKELPHFSAIDKKYIELALVSTDVYELNTRTGTTDVTWGNYSQILVGGQVMDRGFTVEGLIVTYMPRGTGGGNADTIQQRARFFGYKKKYISFCRIYIGADTKDAYEKYLLHEDSLRDIIAEHNKTGDSLNNLKRRVILDSGYRPTRPNIISGQFRRYTLGDWFTIKAPHDCKDLNQNRIVTETFIRKISWKKDKGHKNRTSLQIHDFSEVPLKNILSELFENLSFTRENDSYHFTLLINSLNRYLQHNKSIKCAVYVMSQGINGERGLSEKDEIHQLFQGSNAKTGYPGDREIKKQDQITIQIRKLDLKDNKTKKIIFNDVYSLAVWLPDELGEDYIELIENE